MLTHTCVCVCVCVCACVCVCVCVYTVVDAENALTNQVLAQCDARESFKALFTKVRDHTHTHTSDSWPRRAVGTVHVCERLPLHLFMHTGIYVLTAHVWLQRS